MIFSPLLFVVGFVQPGTRRVRPAVRGVGSSSASLGDLFLFWPGLAARPEEPAGTAPDGGTDAEAKQVKRKFSPGNISQHGSCILSGWLAIVLHLQRSSAYPFKG